MNSQRLHEFDHQLTSEIRPKLNAYEFEAGDERTFRRGVKHEGTQSTQLIEFQIGLKGWSVGRFTVNLAVFNPDCFSDIRSESETQPNSWDCSSDLVQRLGFFRPPHRSVFDRLWRRKAQPKDYWWHQHDVPAAMRSELADVMDILSTQGFAWLDTYTSLDAFRWAARQLERRKHWKANLGAPNSLHLFETEPFLT